MNRCIKTGAGGKCVVLYYHVVNERQRSAFAKQMRQVRRYGEAIRTDQLGNGKLAGNLVAVTFDDGFASFVRNALPEIDACGIPVTIFVPSGCLGKSPSWEGVEEALKRDEVIMDAQQVQVLEGHELVTIGSHCISHSNLVKLEKEAAREEIAGSKRQLEALLGHDIDFVSFPFGSFTEHHVKMAREAQYAMVFTTLPRRVSGDDVNTGVIGRVKVEPDDWPAEFFLKIRGAYRWLPWAFLAKRMIRRCTWRKP